MLNMFNRRQFLILCFIHNLINRGSVPYLNHIFVENTNNTRAGMNTSSLLVSKVKRTRDELLLSHSLSKLWNSVPIKIRNSQSHDTFRAYLYEFLMSEQKKIN